MKIHPGLVLLAALLSALFSSGCATVTRGTTEQLMVQSEPSGASVRVSNGFTGITPVSFTVPRKGDLIVTITKEGYEPVEVSVPSKLAGAGTAGFLGNALIGGVIGGGVDIATGATLSHEPNPVKVTLVKKSETGAPPSSAPPSAETPAAVRAEPEKTTTPPTPST